MSLSKRTTDTWEITVTYKSSASGFTCSSCSADRAFGGHFHYRIYIDDKLDMIGGNLEIKLPISQASGYFNETPVFNAYPWFFNTTGSIGFLSAESAQIGGNRSVLVFKPPSFYENPYKSYPAIFVFDFSEEIYDISREIITSSIVDHGSVGEFILIGFSDYSSNERYELLTQVRGEDWVCINGSLGDACGGCLSGDLKHNFTGFTWHMEHRCGKRVVRGGKGNETLDFLVGTILPKVRESTNNRIFTEQRNVGIMGYSLGGLMSCHAAWTRPHVFGFAACMSPSLWYPNANETTATFFFETVTLKDPILRQNRPLQKIYLDAGSLETPEPWTLTQSITSAAREMATLPVFEWNRNLWASVIVGETHSFTSWIKRIWEPLRLFNPTTPGTGSRPYTGNCKSDILPTIIG